MQKLFCVCNCCNVGSINERVNDKYTDAATFSKRRTDTLVMKVPKADEACWKGVKVNVYLISIRMFTIQIYMLPRAVLPLGKLQI